MSSNDSLPLVSTITPVLNGERYIMRNLQSIKEQTYANIEMIVVDNFSTDRTVEIARSSGAAVHCRGPERASQDNYGVQVARGKYVFITGCDMVLDPEYIAQCVAQCEEGGYDAVYASVRSRVTNYWSKVKGFERDLYIGDDFIESARFFRRDAFLGLGGFDASLVLHADDYDMQKRLNDAGYRTGRISAVETHIDEIDSLREVFLKSFYYGLHSLEYLRKYPSHATKKLFPVRRAFLRHWRALFAHPVLSMGLATFKVVQYAAGGAGLLFAVFRMQQRVGSRFHRTIYKQQDRSV